MKENNIVPLLIEWFGRQARDLPWRRTRDPFAIWVSEIMLQQTQVKTVVPYWTRWMKAVPTISSLAKARPERIHKLWEGLGYYTRVRNMQKAAQMIVSTYGGKFPTEFEEVLQLPGIGRYTAGAICSIAFNRPNAILDGNVIRVLTRVFGIEGDPREKSVNAGLWARAQELVDEADHLGRATSTVKTVTRVGPAPLLCSQLNQSLMELGALVCTPRQPKCDVCPLSRPCVARRQGRTEELPQLAPRQTPTPRRFVAFVVEQKGKFLVRQRPEGVVNAQLWEFPNVEIDGRGENLRSASRKALGFRTMGITAAGTIRHSITRFRIQMDVFRVVPSGALAPELCAGSWLAKRDLRRLAFSSAHKKILAGL
jgi:A/G-specific adenine glycosylase